MYLASVLLTVALVRRWAGRVAALVRCCDGGACGGRCWRFGDNVPTDGIRAVVPCVRPLCRRWSLHSAGAPDPALSGLGPGGDVPSPVNHFGHSAGLRASRRLCCGRAAAGVAETFRPHVLRKGFEIGLPCWIPASTALVDDGDVVSVDVAGGAGVTETARRAPAGACRLRRSC